MSVIVRLLKRLGEERSQVIILFVAIFSIITVMGAMTIDFGLWLSERRGVERAADLAALAGSQSLLRHAGQPNDPGPGSIADEQATIRDACLWAKRNGYEDGKDGVSMSVQLFCRNTDSGFHQAGMCIKSNPSNPNPEACSVVQYCPSILLGEDPQVNGAGCDTIHVTIGKAATHLFSSIFDIPGNIVGFGSWAGEYTQAIPIHAIMTIDRTGSMGYAPCNSNANNPGCPIFEAKNAAKKFTDYLLAAAAGSPQTLVGMAPYNNCYGTVSGCTPDSGSGSMVIGLTNNASQVDTTIGRLTADGSTNICLGIDKANTLLLAVPPVNPITKQAVVLLSDGQNWYTYSQSQGVPPSQCRPSNPTHSDDHTGENPPNSSCYNAQPNQRNLDSKTNTLVNGPGGLKARGIDVYVVGFGVCGTANNNLCNTTMIGTNTHDNSANRNLLKCLASSTPGTNDHYYEVPNASELPNIFQAIAWAITGRSLVQ